MVKWRIAAIVVMAALVLPMTQHGRQPANAAVAPTPGAASCTPTAGYPDEQPGTRLCLQVTRSGKNVALLLSTVRGQICTAAAIFWPPLQTASLDPAAAAQHPVNGQGQLLYTVDTAGMHLASQQLLVTAACTRGQDANMRSVSFRPGDALRQVIAVAALPQATSTPFPVLPKVTPEPSPYYVGGPRGAGGSGGTVSSSGTVSVSVDPNPMKFDDHPILRVRTVPDVGCTPDVHYLDTNRPPMSLDPSPEITDPSGYAQWQWHEETKGHGGKATVTCIINGAPVPGAMQFTVLP